MTISPAPGRLINVPLEVHMCVPVGRLHIAPRTVGRGVEVSVKPAESCRPCGRVRPYEHDHDPLPVSFTQFCRLDELESGQRWRLAVCNSPGHLSGLRDHEHIRNQFYYTKG